MALGIPRGGRRPGGAPLPPCNTPWCRAWLGTAVAPTHHAQHPGDPNPLRPCQAPSKTTATPSHWGDPRKQDLGGIQPTRVKLHSFLTSRGEPVALLLGAHLPLMSRVDGVAAGGGRESRSSCANAACTMTELGSFPAPAAVASVPSKPLSWKRRKGCSVTPLRPPPTSHQSCSPELSYLCWLVGSHAPAQLEGLAAGLGGPARW